MIKKIALSNALTLSDIVSVDTVRAEQEISAKFKDIVASLRVEQEKQNAATKIAPKMEDFLYAHAIQMTAAEANLIDVDSGEFKKNARMEPVRGHFESVKDTKGSDSVKWVSPDGISLYKNANGDIFPEEDLLKAYKDWVGKPLCKDHVSNTVEGIRGIIVDTFYDPKFKRVHALFALDKKNYPDLARKVEAGYLTNVSMGTAVGRSICTECANVATVEAEYCHHVKSKANYGEINKDLKPIELSLVVTGADPRAKIRTVLASFNNYFIQKAAALSEDASVPAAVESVELTADNLKNLSVAEVLDLLLLVDSDSPKYADILKQVSSMKTSQVRDLALKMRSMKDPSLKPASDVVANILSERYLSSESAVPDVSSVGRPTGTSTQPDLGTAGATGHDMAGESLNSEIGKDPTSLVDRNVGVYRTLPDPNSGIATASSGPLNIHNGLKVDADNNSLQLNKSFAMLTDKEIPMNFAELRKRAEARKQAYHQGTEDPAKLPYDKMGDADKVRDTQDKQMVGKELDTSKALPADDAKVKELMQRASLDERRLRRAQILESFTKEAADTPGSVQEKTDSMGQKVMVRTKPDGSKEVLKADDEHSDKVEKKAYFQGTEEPAPGKTKYPLMGEPHDKMRAKDKQMSGQGMEPGADGMHPGYGESDEAVKRKMQRLASIRGTLHKSATPGKSAWKFFSGDKELLTVKAASAYEVGLTDQVENTAHLSPEGKDLTADEFFKTEAYAKEVMKLIRAAGLEKAAAELGGELPAAPMAPEAPAAAAPEAPAADSSNDKIAEALASIESAVEEIRDAAKLEDLKQVDVAAEAAPSAPVAMASFRTQLLKVQAALSESADELATISSTPAATGLVDEAVADAFVVASAASDLLDKIAAKKKDKKVQKFKLKFKSKKKDADDEEMEEDEEVEVKAKKPMKKKAEEVLADLLAARAARREALVATAFEKGDDSDFEDPTTPDLPTHHGHGQDTEEDTVEDLVDMIEGGDAADELAEALKAWDAQDHMMAKDKKDAKDEGDVPGPLNKAEEEEVADIADKEVDKHEKEMHAEDSLMSRKAWRESLLKKVAGEWQSTYEEARKGPGPDVEVDSKVSDKLNKVETLAERHVAMEEVARAEPRNVRMAAEDLNRLVRAGAIKASQLDELVAKGAVDADAAKYWKEFYGQVDGGREFATELTKEFKHSKASLESKASSEEGEAKLMRAYNLSLEAQERGIIAKSRAELHRFASSLVKLQSDQFEAMKNMINQARKPEERVKTAAPVVGLNYDRAETVTKQASSEVSVENLSKLFF